MAVKSRKRGLGIDLGSACFKSVVLGLSDDGLDMLECHRLNVLEEGILNAAESYSSLSSWLDQTGVRGIETTVGLPQFLATTQLSDFPADASQSSLEDMVAFETQQLAGLSEEGFAHDFHVLPAGRGRRNPVLIGICRESVVNERMEALRGAGVPAPRLGIDGLASVNALLLLNSEAGEGSGPRIVMDVGREKTTLVVIAAGQPLYVGSLLFSAETFVRAAMEREGLAEREAEAHLQELDLGDESPRSPYILLTRKLVSEMENAVEHWRAQERQGLDDSAIAGLWLCGGGVRLRGLAAYLGECFACPAQVFGPADPKTGELMPEMAAAFGLAAQSLGQAPVDISLTPVAIRLQAHRQKRFAYLVAACVLSTMVVAGSLVRSYVTALRASVRVEDAVGELEECEKLIPRLEGARVGLERCEAMLTPLVQAGNRSRRFIEAIDALGKACGENDWFIYLADEGSYQEQRGGMKQAPPPLSGGGAGGLFAGNDMRPVVGDTVLVPEFPRRVLAGAASGVDSLIAAGYTPQQRYQPWEPIRALIDTLRAMGPYAKVDLLQESERVGREDIFEPWVRYFLAHQGRLYKPYSVRLQVASPEVVPRVPTVAEKDS